MFSLLHFFSQHFYKTSRHALALLGLIVVLVALLLAARPDDKSVVATDFFDWLNERQMARAMLQGSTAEPTPASRSTATLVGALNSEQLAATQWLSRKYKISPEPLGALVSEAWDLGERSQIAPAVIMAIMAVESRFNPFASGSRGTMGLMQIEPKAHTEALATLGGRFAAFDPLTNLRLGTRLLQSMVQQSNSIEEALFLYGVASGQSNPAQYVRLVLAEQHQLEAVLQAPRSSVNQHRGAQVSPVSED